MTNRSDLAQEWQEMRLLMLFYVRLAREFSLDATACEELETSIEVPSSEDMESARRWFASMDERIQVHQLRQFLQTTTGVNEETLVALGKHHLHKSEHNESDRDKIDFVLVQLLAQTAPSQVEDDAVDGALVASALAPILGDTSSDIPDWLSPLNDLVTKGQKCDSLNGLFSSGILEKGRKIKTASGENYFAREALIGFTRFNYLLRRTFFRLMHKDLNAILDGLRALEIQGVATIDCRAAQFSDQESIARLRMVCQSWKIMFQAEYSSGQPMRILADLRGVIEAALKETSARAAAYSPPPVAYAQGAAAGANSSSSVGAEAPEFEVSGNGAYEPDSPES